MNTQTGKQIALERHRFMEILLHFMRNGMGEVEGSSDAACIFDLLYHIIISLSKKF
jgi:hypothetical protein